MAYVSHSLVSFGGRLSEVAEADEIWECTVRGFGAGGTGNLSGDAPDAGSLQTYVDEIAPQMWTWFAGLPGAQGTMAWVKAANIGADGKYTDNAQVHDWAPPYNHGYSGAAPSFCSIAFSWTTARTRPPAAFGRIYPPNNGLSPMAMAKISTADQTACVASANTLLDALQNNLGSLFFVPAVVSKLGPHAPITGVRVGNVYDVQRRRKNKVRETFIAGAPR